MCQVNSTCRDGAGINFEADASLRAQQPSPALDFNLATAHRAASHQKQGHSWIVAIGHRQLLDTHELKRGFFARRDPPPVINAPGKAQPQGVVIGIHNKAAFIA